MPPTEIDDPPTAPIPAESMREMVFRTPATNDNADDRVDSRTESTSEVLS